MRLFIILFSSAL